MKSSWTDRINELETTPPENTWGKIALSLDEGFSGHSFPSQLHDATAIPPAGTWDKIVTALDELETPAFSVKLYELETAPPAVAWNKIAAGLTTEAIPVIKMPARSMALRYAAAACIFALISFAAIRFFSTHSALPGVASAVNSRGAQQLPADTQQSGSNETAVAEIKNTDGRSLAVNAVHRIFNAPAALSTSLSAETRLENKSQIQYSHRAAVNDFTDDQDPTRYLMFKDSEGRFIKISKKLAGLFCCVSGEEQDDHCHDQLKEWRAKLASASFIPSPDNFMDILDLVNSLEDTRN